MNKKTIAAIALAATMGGAAVGMTLPASAAGDAGTSSVGAAIPIIGMPGSRPAGQAPDDIVAKALDGLVADGTLTQDQADTSATAIGDAFDEARPKGPLDAIATAIGVSVDDLGTALQNGSTIAEVAKNHGVDVAGVIDAAVADATQHLADAVDAGGITQREADQMTEDLRGMMTAMVNGTAPNGPIHGTISIPPSGAASA